MKLRLLCVLALLIFVLPLSAQDEDDVLVDEALVNSVTVDDSDGISLEIEGELMDACTELGEVTQSVEDDTIVVSVMTTRPADAICAAVLAPFELSYELDTSDIEAGDYTLDVNGVTEEITIDENAESESLELTCPEADDETELFEDFGMCFVYPDKFSAIEGRDFVMISQPRTANAVLLISVEEADEVTLEALAEIFTAIDLVVVDDIVIGGQETLIVESDDSREAYIIAHEQLYTFLVQGLEDEEAEGEILWATVIDSVFFPEPDEDE